MNHDGPLHAPSESPAHRAGLSHSLSHRFEVEPILVLDVCEQGFREAEYAEVPPQLFFMTLDR